MKLTLFTISNEQIKEQLSKLQTKVESLETIKDVQDKIISAKDSQISFLNDQIANIWTPITIVAGFIALVFGYVAWLNKQAQKKVDQGEEQISLAQEQILQANLKLQESDRQIETANLLITQSQSVATIAQEKIEELKDKQEELTDLLNSTIFNQQVDLLLKNINFKTEFMKQIITTINEHIRLFKIELSNEDKDEFQYLMHEHNITERSYIDLYLQFNKDIINGEEIFTDERKRIEELDLHCDELIEKYHELYEKIKTYIQ
ncbi:MULTISPECIES: hypothetical protein [Bacillus]|uniref:hypothetical protein n=1 Tax=Bacillus TaxID=1386 RepID=UPI000E100307|nr:MULTISPECIES: hypothetical protein [Bacillus]AXK21482.1 hypothetical protein DPQ31_28845 [Bacillus sp. COPE52]USK99841.1 hypothetical protein LIS81_28300 [Bacillus tropicus]